MCCALLWTSRLAQKLKLRSGFPNNSRIFSLVAIFHAVLHDMLLPFVLCLFSTFHHQRHCSRIRLARIPKFALPWIKKTGIRVLPSCVAYNLHHCATVTTATSNLSNTTISIPTRDASICNTFLPVSSNRAAVNNLSADTSKKRQLEELAQKVDAVCNKICAYILICYHNSR